MYPYWLFYLFKALKPEFLKASIKNYISLIQFHRSIWKISASYALSQFSHLEKCIHKSTDLYKDQQTLYKRNVHFYRWGTTIQNVKRHGYDLGKNLFELSVWVSCHERTFPELTPFRWIGSLWPLSFLVACLLLYLLLPGARFYFNLIFLWAIVIASSWE